MPIHSPSLSLSLSTDHYGDDKKKNTKKQILTSLTLTSMVDMFAIIVVFLLQNFSSQGEVFTIPNDLIIPQTKFAEELKQAVTVTISKSQIVVENMGSKYENALAIVDKNAILISKVAEQLVNEKSLNDKSDKPRSDIKNGLINIVADIKTQFELVRKVIFTCHTAGFQNINLATMPLLASN